MRLPELTALIKRPVAFFTQPLALAQVLSSLNGGLTVLIAAALLEPDEFTTFALLALFANVALGIGRASVFQPAIIQQRHEPDAFVRARIAALLSVLVAASSMLSAQPLGVSTWTGAALIGASALFPTAYDWLRFRAMQNDERWHVALADGVRLAFVPLPLIVAPLATNAVSLQVYFSATAAAPLLLLALALRRRKVFAPYASYARAAAWQLGDFAVGQFIVAVPLLVLGTRATGGVVAGMRLAQALLGPLALVFAATVNTLIADGATRDAFRTPGALVTEGSRLGRNVTLISIATVLLTTAVVSATDIELRGVDTADVSFGLLLVGGYMIMSGWGGIQAIILRLLNQQAVVTLGRLAIAALTLTGFAVAYVGGGADASLISGFLTAGVSSMLVFGLLSRFAREPEPELDPEAEPAKHSEETASAGSDFEPGSEEAAAHEVPAFIQYSPSAVPLYVLGAVLALTAGASALILVVTAADPTTAGLTIAVLLAGCALGAGWAMSNWNPMTIAIRDGVLEVTNRRGETKIDLREPGAQVELGDRPGSLGWRAVIGRPDGETVVVRAQQVKARQFTEIVQHYRNNLREGDRSSTEDDA